MEVSLKKKKNVDNLTLQHPYERVEERPESMQHDSRVRNSEIERLRARPEEQVFVEEVLQGATRHKTLIYSLVEEVVNTRRLHEHFLFLTLNARL